MPIIGKQCLANQHLKTFGGRTYLKKKHVILLAFLAVSVAGAAIGLGILKTKIAAIEKQMAGITIADVDLTNIADGVYNGSCSVFPVAAEVKVTVKDHAITAIELVKHNHGQGAAAEVIPGRVVEAQSLVVDTVSGATYSSNVILKAIENALTGAK